MLEALLNGTGALLSLAGAVLVLLGAGSARSASVRARLGLGCVFAAVLLKSVAQLFAQSFRVAGESYASFGLTLFLVGFVLLLPDLKLSREHSLW